MVEVPVSRLIRVEKDEGFVGSLDANATPKQVVVKLKVTAIPEGGGAITLHLPWGKIFGVAKSKQGKGAK